MRLSTKISISAIIIFCCFAILVSFNNGRAEAENDLDYAKNMYDREIEKENTYLRQYCFDPDYDYQNYEGLPISECIYRNLNLDGRVFLLDIPNEKMARWTTSACKKYAENRLRSCVAHVAKHIKIQSGGQFPVSGVVINSASVVGGPKNTGMYFVFRDGVTVRTGLGKNGTTRQLTDKEIEALTTARVVDVKKYARVVSATREDYYAVGGTVNVGSSASGERKHRWLEVVRKAYVDAWDSETNVIFDAWISKATRERLF